MANSTNFTTPDDGVCVECGCTQATAGRDDVQPGFANLVRSHVDHYLCDNCDRKSGFARPHKCCISLPSEPTPDPEGR